MTIAWKQNILLGYMTIAWKQKYISHGFTQCLLSLWPGLCKAGLTDITGDHKWHSSTWIWPNHLPLLIKSTLYLEKYAIYTDRDHWN